VIFRQLFDPESSTYTYLLADEGTRQAVLIDPVRDQVERDEQLLRELDLKLAYTLETHVHADHIAGSGVLRQRLGSTSVMSARAGASCADRLVETGDLIEVGDLVIEARLTPGHTSGCVSYVVPQAKRVFTGDTLLIRGCGRTDFQQGSAETLYDSVHQQLFTLPDDFAVYPGHDYKGRTSSTIGEEKKHNPRLGGGKSKEEFARIMANLKLAHPKKIDVAVPANLECGLKIPNVAGEAVEKAWAPIERTGGGVPEVTAGWVKAHLGEFRVLDVREEDEYNGPLSHLPGSELVPLGTVEHGVKDWDRKAPVVTVCRSGGRSGRAALALEKMGFERVASLRGGMLVYREVEKSGGAAEAEAEPVVCG